MKLIIWERGVRKPIVIGHVVSMIHGRTDGKRNTLGNGKQRIIVRAMKAGKTLRYVLYNVHKILGECTESQVGQ